MAVAAARDDQRRLAVVAHSAVRVALVRVGVGKEDVGRVEAKRTATRLHHIGDVLGRLMIMMMMRIVVDAHDVRGRCVWCWWRCRVFNNMILLLLLLLLLFDVDLLLLERERCLWWWWQRSGRRRRRWRRRLRWRLASDWRDGLVNLGQHGRVRLHIARLEVSCEREYQPHDRLDVAIEYFCSTSTCLH